VQEVSDFLKGTQQDQGREEGVDYSHHYHENEKDFGAI
jgi:hypothetical protein